MDTSTLATWATFSAVIIGAILSVVRPDNKALPFSISPAKRAMLAAALGAVQACLMAVASGTPWMQAVGTAIVSVVAAFAAHGAPRVIPVAGLLLCMTVGATGCSTLKAWWGGGGEQEILTDAEKIAVDALKGMSLAAIAMDLMSDVLTIAQEVLKNAHLTGTAAQHEAVALRTGMIGVGCAP